MMAPRGRNWKGACWAIFLFFSLFPSFLQFFGIGIRFIGMRGRDVGEKMGRRGEVTGDEDSA
jgi:hypothetical protein